MSTDFGKEFATARDKIFDVLDDLDWHSWRALRAVGGVRYSARLLELRRLGYVIDDLPDPSGTGKVYRLLSLTPDVPQGKQVKIFLPESDVKRLLEGIITGSTVRAVRDAYAIFQANRHKL